jgi:hypothetical protein
VERELLLVDQPLHVVGEDAHQLPASVSISANAIVGSMAALPPMPNEDAYPHPASRDA